PDKLEREADFLARHPGVGAVFSDLEKHDGPRFAPSFMRTTEVFSPRLREGGPAEMVLGAREMYLWLLQEAIVKTPALTVRRRGAAAAACLRWGLALPSSGLLLRAAAGLVRPSSRRAA